MLLSTNIDKKKIIARIDEKFPCSIDLWVVTLTKRYVPFILGIQIMMFRD